METIQELFRSLESINPQIAEEAKNTFHEMFISTKESWLLNGMFEYYLQSGSFRAVDVLISVREPHDRYLFDRLTEALRGSNRLPGLTLLSHVVRRHPLWIYKIASHTVFKELLKVLKSEKDIVILMSALLIVVVLLPIIASLISPHLQDLFEIFSHLAVWNTNNPYKVPEGYLIHLEIGMYALFNRLYGMFPCNFLFYLRQHYNSKESLPVFSQTIKPMLDTVRMHPLLVTASKELETSANRWKKIEANDVIIECSKFSIESHYDRREDLGGGLRGRTSSFSTRPRFSLTYSALDPKQPDGYVELGNHGVPVVGSFSSNLPESSEVWSPAVCSGAVSPQGSSSIPQTPIIQGCVVSTYSPQGGNSPPEAAIEATPESTPIKDLQERPDEGVSPPVVRPLHTFHSQPSSPLRKSAPPPSTGFHRVHRVITERVQVETSGGIVGAARGGGRCGGTGSPLRLVSQLEKGRPLTPGDRTDEDREVEVTFASASVDVQQVRREDSVLGEKEETTDGDEDGDEWREWREGGALRMPEASASDSFVRRLRCLSQCQPVGAADSFRLPQLGFPSTAGSSPKDDGKLLHRKLRKTLSCPDLARSGKARMETLRKSNKESSSSSWRRAQEDPAGGPKRLAVSRGSQTEPPGQEPLAYGHLLFSVLPSVDLIQQHSAPPDVTSPPTFRDDHLIPSPRAALDCYIESTAKSLSERQKQGLDKNEIRGLREQLVLLTLQLQFERHRREVHAERNRRLLGRYRENRVLEEHNSALRDQVGLLQSDIEMLHTELSRLKRESEGRAQLQQGSLSYAEEKNCTLQRLYKEATETIQTLNLDLIEEKRRRETIAKGYAKLESEVFGLRNIMDDAMFAVERAEEVKSELGHLQVHVQAAGELETRLRSQIQDLSISSNKDIQFNIAARAYQLQIKELQKKIDVGEAYREEANEKFKKAIRLNAAREEIAQEQNKIMDIFRSECDQMIQEKEDACDKLRSLNTEREVLIRQLKSKVEILEDKVTRLSEGKASLPQVPTFTPRVSSAAIPMSDESGLLQNLQLIIEEEDAGPSTHLP